MTSRQLLGMALAATLASALAAGCTVEHQTDAAVRMDANTDTNVVPVIDVGPTQPDTSVTCDPGLVSCNGTCTRVAADSMNCGSCGVVCPEGVTCAVGRCTCNAPRLSCDGLCTDLQTDPEHCGTCDNVCDATQICSMGECIVMCTEANHRVCVNTDAAGTRTQVCADLMNDNMNCGTCNTRCTGTSTCVAGVCVCPGGGISCGAGCIDPMTDVNNCGACLNSCGADGTCAGGRCTACGTGLTSCGSPARCVNTSTSTLHCGTCGNACPGLASCNGGTCECPASAPTECSGQCVDTQTNPLHCNACGNACPTGSDCVGGVCQCPGTETACGAACTDTMTDTHNCGSCGRACSPTSVCTAGSCVCPGTQVDCSGVCVDTQTDVNNCGGCDQNCAGGTCTSGVCACTSGLTLCGGSCVNLLTNQHNCNMCGNDCGMGMACHAGVCEPADSFRVLTFGATGCRVVDHNAASGDDRGGVAVSPTQFFVQGDTAMARMNAADLSSITSVGVAHTAIVQNVDSEEAYLLLSATGTEPSTFGSGTFTFTQLGVLDGSTGALTATRITLSTPITVAASGVAIMSGYGEALIGNPVTTPTAGLQWYRIGLPDGEVTTLGRTPNPTHRSCESWGWWGIAERYAGSHAALYVESTTRIARLTIPDTGASTTAATMHTAFTNLGDMCSITFSTSRNRWYFHHEYDSQFGGDSLGETAGYCPGTFDRP